MLEALVGSTNAERVLLFLAARGEGYPAEIARTFDTAPSMIKKQLDRMERDGLLIRREVGKTLLYTFNPRNPFSKDVQEFFRLALDKYPEDVRARLTKDRRRPRKRGKVL